MYFLVKIFFLDMCRICYLQRVTHTYVPCGHYCACAECAHRVWAEEREAEHRCPMCRTNCTAPPMRIWFGWFNSESLLIFNDKKWNNKNKENQTVALVYLFNNRAAIPFIMRNCMREKSWKPLVEAVPSVFLFKLKEKVSLMFA